MVLSSVFVILGLSIVQQTMRHNRVKDPLKENVPFSGIKVYDDLKIYLFLLYFDGATQFVRQYMF